MTALVFLFFAEAQRAFFGSLFALGYEAVFPSLRVAGLLQALLPVVALAAPAVPVARWVDRSTAVMLAAVGVALFRLPMTDPSLVARAAGSALTLACAGIFVVWAVGEVDRQAVGAGAVVGLVVDQLLRLAGHSYDLSLQPGWLPVQAVLSLTLVTVAVLWVRSPRPTTDAGELERRAGGLRLRGGLALAALLFLDLHVLGSPPVAAAWTGVPYPAAALTLAGAAGLAVGLVLTSRRPGWSRVATLSLAGLAAVAVLAGYWTGGVGALAVMAAGHVAALVLIPRSLDPASGRRSGGIVAGALLLLVVFTALYVLTFYHAFALPVLSGGAPWLFIAAGALLAGSFFVLPRPAPLPPVMGVAGAVAAGAVVLGAAVGLTLRVPAVRQDQAAGASLRVATYNVHSGYDAEWRFHPERIAAVLEAAEADVVALQEVPVGLPSAYGVDLPLWLGHRLGARPLFAGAASRLLGDAFLVRVPVRDFTALPATVGEPGQVVRLRAQALGREVAFLGLHLPVEPGERPHPLRAALGALGPGPAVVLGDLSAGAAGPVADLLKRAGFQDAFGDPASARATFPTSAPTGRIDRIWVRGLAVGGAGVLEGDAPDPRGAAATLQSLSPSIR